MSITISHSSDWRPEPTQLATCPKCQRPLLYPSRPHAPHWLSTPTGLVLVDCKGVRLG